jgi:hypothetical protein
VSASPVTHLTTFFSKWIDGGMMLGCGSSRIASARASSSIMTARTLCFRFMLSSIRARIRQTCPTDEALAQQPQLYRDYHMTRKDLANMAMHIADETWRLAGDAATSVHIWAQENSGARCVGCPRAKAASPLLIYIFSNAPHSCEVSV